MTEKNLAELPDILGTAVRVGNFENNSPEWHALRKTGIGGSDVAAITNCNPWTSPFTLWAKKTGRIEDTVGASEAAEWGTRLEPVVLDKFQSEHPELIIYRNVGTWAHQDRPWQLANPDAIFQDANGHFGIIEIKTARYQDDWANGVPAYYRTQVNWYMQTFGFKSAYVATLFAGSHYEEFALDADDFEQSVNLEAVEKFRTYLETDLQPDFDGALNTMETVRELHPDIDPELTVELGDLGMYCDLALMELAEAEKKANELKSRVLDAMGQAKRGMVHDIWRFTRQARNGGRPYLITKKG